ncbi:ATP-dependent RNA helicase p62 [Rhipicephalus sanguineus]|uniref:ATP-dependent RNA helicase p62 n=1 Tax=Rhipicephalus sanguineus TaxID=34632 RepID=UPI001893C34C|nr:ATP-dependent RNA helicase p62 [Rhipicephalus sanguineus]
MADEMVIELRHRDWSVVGIHGAKTRDERQKALDAFKSGSSSILVLDRRCSSAAGRRPNVVGIAETGSHKMLAYVLPAVIHDSRHPPRQRHEGPIAVLLAPTREVAKQIHSMAYELGKHAAERIVCAANGERKKSKYAELQGGCHIFVATPRCLIEFLEEGQVNLHRCTYLVFDEVDRMLSMGYQRHVLKIVELCRPDRQTLMWATS